MRKSLYNEILILSKHERTCRYLSLLYFENHDHSGINSMNLPFHEDVLKDNILPEDEHIVMGKAMQV
jgi:hypothetical protein